ncbi:DUF3967 domain-containing protein [Bacillus sp. FSL W8-0102]|jgi:DNA-binding transcriptional MerR regulator
MLEEQGYSFQKDNNNWRQYNEDDIQYLKYISSMKAKGKSLDQAIQHIASLYHSNLTILQPDMSLQEPEKKLLNFIQQQEELNHKILDQLEAQERRQIERDQNLMRVLNELQETKRQIAATAGRKDQYISLNAFDVNWKEKEFSIAISKAAATFNYDYDSRNNQGKCI